MSDLRKIAEAATRGPWFYLGRTSGRPDPDWPGYYFPFVFGPNEENPICQMEGDWLDEHENAAHIAAWSPERALAAMDVIEATRLVIGYLDALAEEFPEKMPMLQDRGDRLRDALRRWEALP